jgi:hypothetical protein
VEFIAEAKGAKRGSGLEDLRARRGLAARSKAGKRGKFPELRQSKNALREHPDDEFFGFVE